MLIKKLVENYKIKETGLQSERAELIKQFLEELNPEREKNGFKPLSPAYISMKLSDCGLKTNPDIYQFLNQCKQAKSFGKYFFWATTPKE